MTACAGTNRAGQPCRSRISPDREFCGYHGPCGIVAKRAEQIAEQQIFEQLADLESTPEQWNQIEWLILRLNPNAAQLAYLVASVCGGPVTGPLDLSKDQADALANKLRYHADRAA